MGVPKFYRSAALRSHQAIQRRTGFVARSHSQRAHAGVFNALPVSTSSHPPRIARPTVHNAHVGSARRRKRADCRPVTVVLDAGAVRCRAHPVHMSLTSTPSPCRWLSERYPLVNQPIDDATLLPEVDNLYLDLNGEPREGEGGGGGRRGGAAAAMACGASWAALGAGARSPHSICCGAVSQAPSTMPRTVTACPRSCRSVR